MFFIENSNYIFCYDTGAPVCSYGQDVNAGPAGAPALGHICCITVI